MSEVVHIACQVALTQKQIEDLGNAISGNEDVAKRIADYAAKLLISMASGGLILEPEEVAQIEGSIGRSISGIEDLLPLLEAGSGMSGGYLVGTWRVDPVYQPNLEEKAAFQEITIAEMIQRTIDTCVDEGWLLGDVIPHPQRILMTPEDYEDLKALLGGKDFYSGAELAVLVRGVLGASAEEQSRVAEAMPDFG